MYTKLDQSNRKTQSGKFHFFLEFCLLFLQVAVVSVRPFWYICNAFYSMEYIPVVNTHIQRSDVERTSFNVGSTFLPTGNPVQALCWQT